VAGIRLFDDKEMSIHALNLLSSVSLYHTDLVSNWTVVVVFSFFAAAGLVSVAVSSDPSHYRRNALLVGGVLALSAMLLTFSIMTQ
jgi:CHASE2 domain-containing sensor protein